MVRQLSLFKSLNRVIVASLYPDVIRTYRPALESAGYGVRNFADGFAVLALLETERSAGPVKTAVILFDLRLPSLQALLVNMKLNRSFHIPCIPLNRCSLCGSKSDPKEIVTIVDMVLNLVEEGKL